MVPAPGVMNAPGHTSPEENLEKARGKVGPSLPLAKESEATAEAQKVLGADLPNGEFRGREGMVDPSPVGFT